MDGIIKKSFRNPEAVAEFTGARVETVTISGVQVRRLTCEPGWVWSESVGARMGRGNCPLHHAIWVVTSGRFAVRMEDGTTEEFGPGDIGAIPPRHEAWGVGDETVVGIDILAESLGTGPDRGAETGSQRSSPGCDLPAPYLSASAGSPMRSRMRLAKRRNR